MHIEPGLVAQAKVMFANVAAGGVLASYAKFLVKQPGDILRTMFAALFFSIFMESFYASVGPSELHFVGAMVMYLTLGFVPTLFGFAIGLLLQGFFFTPTDLVHLGVNSLSLIIPLITVHYTIGKKYREQGRALGWKNIVKLDAMYYAGVTSMVGFWLLLSDVQTPFASWAAFAASYLVVVVAEPIFTFSALQLLKRYEHKTWIQNCFAVTSIRLAK